MSAEILLREAALELRRLRGSDPAAYASVLDQCSADELADLLSCWQLYARPNQLRPEGCNPIWLRQAGRGEGKTRSAAEHTLDLAEDWGATMRGILCNKTIGDVRDVMIEGESGMQACAARRGYNVRYIPSQSKVVHPSGATFHLCSSEQPEKPRGYQSNYIWGDEIAAWRNAITTFDNLMYGWRLPCPGEQPLMTLTTTPRPNPIMFRLVRAPALKGRVTISRGSTADNRANLAPDAVKLLEAVYEGTRLGRQELDGELFESFGALLEQDTIHEFRVDRPPELSRRIVSLDPSIDNREESDGAGIVVCGLDHRDPGHGYLLDDVSIEQAKFSDWARASVRAFLRWDCDCVVAEVNQGGGGIVEAIEIAAREAAEELKMPELIVPVKSVWARESKRTRAEPVASLYERGRIHHVGHYKQAEKEWSEWMPGMKSPNTMDAIVHGFTHLLLGDKPLVGPLSSYY